MIKSFIVIAIKMIIVIMSDPPAQGRVSEVKMDPALKAAGWDKYQDFR